MSLIKVNTIQNANGTTALTIAANGQLSRVNTAIISDGTNSTSATNVIQGSAKAWAQFTLSGTTPVVNSYNISSITRTASGRYYADFTNAMQNANYSVVGTGSIDTGFAGFTMFCNAGVAASPYYTAPTTTRFYFSMYIPAAYVVDSYYTTFAIYS